MLLVAQTKLIAHVTTHDDRKNKKTIPVIQFKMDTEHTKVGRCAKFHCSACTAVLHSDLLHPNIKITIDDGKTFETNRLDAQLAISTNIDPNL